MTKLRIILGTMSFGGALNEIHSHTILKDFVKKGYSEIDTAIVYQEGTTEKIIGKLDLCRDSQKVQLACKVNPKKGFTTEKVVEQFNESLTILQVPSVDILYLHLPDHNISVEETLKGVDQLHREGKFKEFGLSNYASWEVADICHICKQNGYILPTVYQGMYNALSRDIELELIPVLRRFGIRFYVYNPLAGGLLSEKYNFSLSDQNQLGGRFFPSSESSDWANMRTKVYQNRFWRKNYKSGVQTISKVLHEAYGTEVSLLEASMRWLCNHSKLVDGDGIILGVSKPEHLQHNIDACNTLTLNENVLSAFDEAWNSIKSDCPKYYR